MPRALRLVIVHLVCIMSMTFGCMPNQDLADSNPSGAFPVRDDLIPVPKDKNPGEISKISAAIASNATRVRSQISGLDPVKNLRLSLVREVKKGGGIPRHQIKEVLVQLLADDNVACGGASCARVFGIEQEDIDEFLDETYRELAADQTLAKQENAGLRRLYLGSFKRGPNETVPPVTSLPVQVIYKLVRYVGKSGFTISDPNFNFFVEFFPGDLRRAHKLNCTDDTCEATVLKPVSININSPAILNTQVIVRYEIGLAKKSGQVQHEAFVGGRFTPVSVGKVLSISIDFWAEIERSARTEYKTVIKNFDCGGSVYCNTPWFTAGAIVGREGIHFDSYITAAGSLGSFAKVTGALPTFPSSIKYKDLPEKIRKIKQAVDSGSLGEPPSLDPDILWAAFVGAPAPQ